MDERTCYAVAIGLCLLASLFLGLTALAGAPGGRAISGFVGAFDAAIGLVGLGAAAMFLLAGRAHRI